MTTYSRENPSPRYQELLALYREMHDHGIPDEGKSAEQTFDGRSFPQHASNIHLIIGVLGSKTLLDYGAGKGKQYEKPVKLPDGRELPNLKAFWGVDEIACYDPAYGPFSTFPTKTYHGVLSTDVMEHCPKEDLPWIIGEMFSLAREFVYVNVALYPARKTLPNGENAHCTVEQPEWWLGLFNEALEAHPGLRYFVDFRDSFDAKPKPPRRAKIGDAGEIVYW